MKIGRKTLPKDIVQSSNITERVRLDEKAAYNAIGGKAWLIEAIRLANEIAKPGRKITATFVPQTVAKGILVNAKPKGAVCIDITGEVIAWGKAAALSLKDGSVESARFKTASGAPAWIKKWDGPFIIQLEQSISEYFS